MKTSKVFYHLIDLFIVVSSVIFDRLADNGRIYQQATMAHLSNYAEDGLRTMLFAYKKIEVSEYERWNTVFTKARTTVGTEREELLEHASEMIEKDLFLLGAVAIEDKLQKGVSSLSAFLSLSVLPLFLIYRLKICISPHPPPPPACENYQADFRKFLCQGII